MKKLALFKFIVLLSAFIVFHPACLVAQTPPPYIDVSKIKYSDTILSKTEAAFISQDKRLADIKKEEFSKGSFYKAPISPGRVAKKAILKFNLSNTSDSIQKIIFFPGLYFTKYNLYYQRHGNIIEFADSLPPKTDSIGYHYLEIMPKDSLTIFAELFFEKTYTNHLRPRILKADNLEAFISDLRHAREDLNIMTYIFCGLLLMMIFFSVTSFLMNGSFEFLYYSGYAFFLGLMLFTKTIFDGQTNRVAFFLESYLDFIMQSLGVIFYMLFMQLFLNTKEKFKFLYQFYNIGIAFLILTIISFSYFHFFTSIYTPGYYIETISKFVLLIMIIGFLVYGFVHWNAKLLRFLVWGNLALFIFSLLSQLIITLNFKLPDAPIIFNSSLFYYELGLIIELFLFLLGLNYKNRLQIIRETRERERLKSENQLKEAEKKLAVYKAQQEERNRISLDMHDELGSGMTAIRLMSEIAKKKMDGTLPKEIDRISRSANDLLNKMNAIIWSMNSRNDSLDNLVSYIRTYTLEYFENTMVIAKVRTPEKNPFYELTGDIRRNIFLCVKESLNNLVKHSQASVVEIDISCTNNLQIKIHDNGVGIDLQNLRQFGNGLQNIEKRMTSIGGTFHIENNGGTITLITLPFSG